MLTRLTKKPRSTPFIVLDIESKDGESRTEPGFTRPFMVGVYDGATYVEFRDDDPNSGEWDTRYFMPGGCVYKALRYILQRKYRGHHIYAHNAGRFDYLFLLPALMQLESFGFTFEIIPVSSSIQVMDVKKGDARFRFLDSVKLIPAALDKALKAFGLPGKLEHDLGLHEEDARWTDYLKQDCVGLYQLLMRFHFYIERTLGGEVGITAPATSMKVFRRRYLKRNYPRSIETHEFVRRGYCGGRVEVHHSAGTTLRYYDINSSYPRAMLEAMPVGAATQWDGPPPAVLQKRIGFVECDVYVPPDIIIPPLPIKAGVELPHAKGKLVFPVGKLHGIWEWSELQKAVSLGATIERYGHSVWYEGVPIFKEYVNDIYQYRDKSRPEYDEGLAQVAKILLNSLYGKFGMRTERLKIYRWNDPDLPIEAYPANRSDPDCLIWYAKTEVDAPYIMPQISARVTALARVRLLDAMLEAKRRGGDLFYCDTDSVITNVELETSTELGALKDEYPEASGRLNGRFLGPKLYALETVDGFSQVKAKGFQERTLDLLARLEAGGVIMQERLEKIGTLAQAGFTRGPCMRLVPRSLRGDSGKREMLVDGSTRPWEVSMW